MKIKQLPVLRFYFSSEQEAQLGLETLETMGIFGDMVAAGTEEAARWKVIFTEGNASRVREALRRIPNKPKAVEVFDPTLPLETGFRSLSGI